MANHNEQNYWINGHIAQALTVDDRGLQYGDGFFTTVAIYEKSILNWPAHWQRIMHGYATLHMPSPDREVFEQQLADASAAYLNAHQITSCVVKLLFTRGSGGSGYQAPSVSNENYIFYFKPDNGLILPDTPSILDQVGFSPIKASIHDFAGLKTLNRLENVMARTQAVEQALSEAIMLNAYGHVVCGTQSNVFMVQGQKVVTPKLEHSGVAGTCRAQLALLLNDFGFEYAEETLTRATLEQAEELFFTNAIRGVQPVRQLEDNALKMENAVLIAEKWHQWQSETATRLSTLINS